ncbi:hypothetical protein [Candidatus Electronema sp. JM]|uniref:hypothetical protein n=1 Tax=Candidatus Electronema sp. JM TaxID=3401571 RepID=UPI003AA8E7C9
MNMICVVQGGKFLLGINAEAVLARSAWAEAAQRRKAGEKIFQLGALLSRQPGGAVPPDTICLELRGQHEPFCLLVDRIVDEAEVINPPGPLPPACPRLAARLCPQVTLWGDTPVLLLNPAQIIPVAEALGKGIGLLAEEPEETAAPSEPEMNIEEDDPFFPAEQQTAAAPIAEEELDEPEEEGPVASRAEGPAAACGGNAQDQELLAAADSGKKKSSTIDEEIFKQVMSWTVARFKQSRSGGEELRFGIEELPPELADMVVEQGLSKNIIQYLIDQIVLRCKESGKSSGRRLPGDRHAG